MWSVSQSDLPKVGGGDPFASLFGGMGGMGAPSQGPNGMPDPFASLFGGMGGHGYKGAGALPGLGGAFGDAAGANPFGGANSPFGAMNPFGGGGANPFGGGAAGSGDPMSAMLGGAGSPVGWCRCLGVCVVSCALRVACRCLSIKGLGVRARCCLSGLCLGFRF